MDSEDANPNTDENRTANKPSLISSFDKGQSHFALTYFPIYFLSLCKQVFALVGLGEGRMAKFFNAFRRKKLSEENVSVNAAWADVERSE